MGPKGQRKPFPDVRRCLLVSAKILFDHILSSLEEMKRSNAEPETTATIKRRIDELKTQHTKDMECLYAYYAHIYRQEQEDLRFSKDDSLFLERDDSAGLAELAEFEARLEVNLLWSCFVVHTD